MSDAKLTRTRFAGGIWEGLLTGRFSSPPRILLRHKDEVVGEAEIELTGSLSGEAAKWVVRIRLPVDRIGDGAQTFVFEDAQTGVILAHETIIAGDAAAEDMRAEIDLLRAELDLLKRAFRKHCAEG